MRIGRPGAQQDGRRANRPGGEHDMAGTNADPSAGIGVARRPDGLRLDPFDPATDDTQAIDPHPRQQPPTPVENHRQQGDQGGLLGVGRAAEAAGPKIPAAADIARHDLALATQGSQAAPQNGVVGVGWRWPGHDTVPRFGIGKPRRHRSSIGHRPAMVLAPMVQRWLWRAQAGRPVHQRRTAHRPALQDGNGLVRRFARGGFLIQLGIGAALLQLEIPRRAQRPLLEQDDIEPGAGQAISGCAATGTGADHHDIAFQLQIAGLRTGIDVLPAGIEGMADGVEWPLRHD